MHESTNRCNGHIQVSSIGKAQKRDRKGCKKGKIEMIMKNSMGATAKAPKLLQQHHMATAKKTTSTKLFGGGPTTPATNHRHLINSGSVIKNEIIDDPYTFTDSEPQTVGLYSATNCLSSTRKVQSSSAPTALSNALARKVTPALTAATSATNSQRTVDAPGKTMRSVATSVDTMSAATAKTINQLQADIARNRVAVVKRRKVVPPTPPPPPPPQPSNPPPPYLQHLLTNHLHASTSSSTSISASSLSSSSSQRHNPPPLPPPPTPPQRAFARVSLPAKRLARQTTWQRERRSRHELLQRIQEAQQQLQVDKRDLFPLGLELSESEDDELDNMGGSGSSAEVYQRHWFAGAEAVGGGRRESRLAQVRGELRRRLRQVWHGVEGGGGAEEPPPALVRSVLTAARAQPTATALLLDPKLLASYSKQSRAKVSMLDVKQCVLCERRALPCTRHCTQHIMYNVDQLLFAYCTAKLPDHTQCRVPVFDLKNHLPLCPLHASTHVNVSKPQPDTTPKRSRKRTKPSSLNRSRSKKKKKSRSSTSSSTSTSVAAANFGGGGGVTAAANVSLPAVPRSEPASAITPLTPITSVDAASVTAGLAVNEMADVFQAAVHSDVPQVEIEVQLDGVEVPEEVLAIASMDPAELASQASKLLEDHDFTNMLLPPDAFNDLFTEDKNGQYEPTREETEELERALEAVDKDVRSLERTLTGLPLPLPLPIPLDTAMTLLDDVTALAPPPPQPPPPYPSAAPAYSNGHHFAAASTDLRNS